MADYKYDQLKHMTVAQLREIAQGIQSDTLDGFSTMHKDHLLPLLCKVLNIPTHHIAAGEAKTRIKAMIRKYQAGRDEARKAGDAKKAALLISQIHTLKHQLRVMAKTA